MKIRLLIAGLLISIPLTAGQAQQLPTIPEMTQGMDRRDGLFPVFWDAREGKVYLEIPTTGEDFLYITSLPAGLGSNDIGLDRSLLGATRLVRFERIGPKILMVMPNLRFRAESDDLAERRAVNEAFAEAVIWGFSAVAESDARILVDATDFVVRDAQGIARQLRGAGQGTFAIDQSRSAVVPELVKAFPRNTELEARVTFTSDAPGGYVRQVAADPYAVTLRVRHSLVKLPDPGFEPRVFHPGSGFMAHTWRDYAAPIGDEMVKRFVRRHRLTKSDPSAAVSDAVEPIVYYLDPGTPEPVRGALLDGARWWAEAFEAAGFTNAFRVELLPEDADPMDVRYNTIQWVHRSTRGWSYGSSVADPRTGEIIKGHVSLGSLRVRQDYLIAEGLLSPYGDSLSAADPMLEMALDRIRQLSAHEVGHTLGLTHNFAASAKDRASVMDYPAPLATLNENGSVSLENAYSTGIGDWDKTAIAYGYSQPVPGESEAEMLTEILTSAAERGLRFITDADARPAGAAHPLSNLWDNGKDMALALDDEMSVRAAALEAFGERAIRLGRPLATLEEVLVPLYLRHRYQVEATAKMLGGVTYAYAMRGDRLPLPEPVPGGNQEAAMDALIRVIQPVALRLPANIRTRIPPRPPGYGPHRELFDGHTGLTFDPYMPAATVASLVFGFVLHPERAARLTYQHDFDPMLPDFETVLEAFSSATWGVRVPIDPYDAELQRVVQQVWVDELLGLAANRQAAGSVRAMALQKLQEFHEWLVENPGSARDEETWAHRGMILDEIDRYLLRDYEPYEFSDPVTIPPGSPIGLPGFEARREMRRAVLHASNLERCSM